MKRIIKTGLISVAAALILTAGFDTANAQTRRARAQREYREDVRDARQDYNRRVRQGNYNKARREYREDMRDARREYVRNVNRDRNGWWYWQNKRRIYRPSSQWYYRNGYFYRRYR